MPARPIVNVKGLTKQYGRTNAVRGVTLAVFPGDIYALVGANGAGKTTLLKIIMGLLEPDTGTVTIGERTMSLYETAAKRRMGYVPDNPGGFEYVTGREFLLYTGTLRGMSGKPLTGRIEELLGIFPVAEIASEYMGGYSRGGRQKFAILASLISDPDVLIIDEPIVGLDPSSIVILGKLLTRLAKEGKAILLVTHILDFAARYATRVGVMEKGALTREITASEVQKLESTLSAGL